MTRLLAAIRRTWRGLTSAPTLPPEGCAVSRLDLLSGVHEMRWDATDPATLDGTYQRDPRLGAS